MDIAPRTPFGPNIQAFLLYLHHSHHVVFERLSRLMGEMFGLAISEGAIANAFRRRPGPREAAYWKRRAMRSSADCARARLSHPTSTRIDGRTHWH